MAITLELQKIIQFCKKFQYSEELLYPEKQKSKFRPFFRIFKILNLSSLPSASVAITLELQKIIQFCKKFQYSEELLYPEKQKSKFRPFFRIYTVPPPPPPPLNFSHCGGSKIKYNCWSIVSDVPLVFQNNSNLIVNDRIYVLTTKTAYVEETVS